MRLSEELKQVMCSLREGRPDIEDAQEAATRLLRKISPKKGRRMATVAAIASAVVKDPVLMDWFYFVSQSYKGGTGVDYHTTGDALGGPIETWKRNNWDIIDPDDEEFEELSLDAGLIKAINDALKTYKPGAGRVVGPNWTKIQRVVNQMVSNVRSQEPVDLLDRANELVDLLRTESISEELSQAIGAVSEGAGRSPTGFRRTRPGGPSPVRVTPSTILPDSYWDSIQRVVDQIQISVRHKDMMGLTGQAKELHVLVFEGVSPSADAISEDEIALAANLSEGATEAIEAGFYTEAVLEEVFAAIYKTYGLTEADWPEIEAAINEFVDEHWEDEDVLSEAKKKPLKVTGRGVAKTPKKPGLISRALSWVARQAAGHVEKKLAGVKTQKGTAKHTLVHAARGALKHYAGGRSAGETVKKAVGRLATTTAKKAVKKGMKMVFGTWREVDGKGGAPKQGEAPKGEAPKAAPAAEPKAAPKGEEPQKGAVPLTKKKSSGNGVGKGNGAGHKERLASIEKGEFTPKKGGQILKAAHAAGASDKEMGELEDAISKKAAAQKGEKEKAEKEKQQAEKEAKARRMLRGGEGKTGTRGGVVARAIHSVEGIAADGSPIFEMMTSAPVWSAYRARGSSTGSKAIVTEPGGREIDPDDGPPPDMGKVKEFAERLQQAVNDYYQREFPTSADIQIQASQVQVKKRKKMVAVDVGSSGKFLVGPNDFVWGIKGYGVRHPGYFYGTLDEILKSNFQYDYSIYAQQGSK